jgi:DNA (cytosine-5)-methyltransferase 1
MKYFSMFTGIGGFELGFPDAWECIGFSEIDKHCNKLLHDKFKEVMNYGDATKIKPDELPDFDMLCGGFPCQAFTIAGERKGFEDTRGTLFFEIERILAVKRPKIVFLENVKGLLSHEKGQTFRIILQRLESLGYNTQWMVLNSKFFGVPQNRERVFIIGSLRGEPRPEIFPYKGSNKNNKIKTINCGFHRYRTYGVDGVSPTLLHYHRAGYSVIKIEYENKIRNLTPLEYERLQGFPNNWTKGFDDITRYEMVGNAVTIPIIKYISTFIGGETC